MMLELADFEFMVDCPFCFVYPKTIRNIIGEFDSWLFLNLSNFLVLAFANFYLK